MKFIPTLLILAYSLSLEAMNYTSYFTGNPIDVVTSPAGGVCMMGGASESDDAMIWFLQRANGGDVLVLRASGTDGYNDYLYSQLGVTVNSVETIVFHNANAATDAYIHQRIQQAEAIWFAGGDQWDYVSYWRNNLIEDYLNDAIQTRNAVIGGTSAGMAILGGYYFSAENGTVSSNLALGNPYHPNVTVDSEVFLEVPYLSDVITDTHYDNPDRKGRHSVFLARILTDEGVEARGIACEEYTAVCIDQNGLARVFGEYPSYTDVAYFIQTNCELPVRTPETCTSGSPLTWNLNQQALRVYQVNGTTTGTNTFNLADWQTGSGGSWRTWYVNNGSLSTTNGSQITCSILPVELLYFNAELTNRQAVKLSWATAWEAENAGFVIEHSSDGRNWKDLAELQGQGNSSETQLYSWVHLAPARGITYYRLRQIDQDGSVAFSDIRSVEIQSGDALNIYPNPTSGALFISNKSSEELMFSVYGNTGQILVNQQTISPDSEIQLNQLASGIYWLRYLDEAGEMFTRKLVVVKD
ncbi:MAG: T9SS type A sorting domain-containing protein [Saprospiraceae bacterium]|nr:T9SS type A sorting domain-containing protein [Saprospiraceae bacterium]